MSDAPIAATARAAASPYAWFLGSVGSWALAGSMNQVIFSWLVVGELRASAQWVGVAQMCLALPTLGLVLFGGLLADRVELRRLVAWLHVAAAAITAALAAAIAADHLALSLLLAFAIAWGTIQAFVAPARDAQVSNVATGNLLRAITGATLVQFAASAAGSRLGGIAEPLGSAAALTVQAGILLAGLLAVRQLPAHTRPTARGDGAGTLAALRSGLVEVAQSPRLLPVALLVAANGLFFMGPFQVLGPLLIRDVYRGGARELALQWMVLSLGAMAGSLAVLLRGGLRRQGRAFLAALVGVCACLFAIAASPPFWSFVGIVFAWGVLHSLFFNTSRALFQENASSANRARVLSVHSLGFLGMTPLSNLGCGLLARAFGPAAGCAIAGAAMLAVVAAALLTSAEVRRMITGESACVES
jgi:hypothetical protein